MISNVEFQAWPNLTGESARPECRASVIVPVRNEAVSLAMTLDGLSQQVDIENNLLPQHLFEVLLLLNNCTDESEAVANKWKDAHPLIDLHVLVCTLTDDRAHVGTARRMLMDTAWHRLNNICKGVYAILSTDSDSVVAPDWIARNLVALETGADAVGGMIQLKAGELDSLPNGARQGYLLDRTYQSLVARFEDLLDPQEGDRWPRHLEHFGASLACTTNAYAKSGGMPPVKPLEDVAFVQALRRSGCVVRHDPKVVVYTSSRLDGRVDIGLSHQLRQWQHLRNAYEPHRVDSGEWLAHRFKTLAHLRRTYKTGLSEEIPGYLMEFTELIERATHDASREAEFLIEVDCEAIIHATFIGQRFGTIEKVNSDIVSSIEILENAQSTHA